MSRFYLALTTEQNTRPSRAALRASLVSKSSTSNRVTVDSTTAVAGAAAGTAQDVVALEVVVVVDMQSWFDVSYCVVVVVVVANSSVSSFTVLSSTGAGEKTSCSSM